MEPQGKINPFVDVLSLMPKEKEIPEDFYDSGNPYVKQTSKWFSVGMRHNALRAKSGINKLDALRHMSAIMQSFDLKHERKIAATAYLMSEWFNFV